jgi:cation transport ATPase
MQDPFIVSSHLLNPNNRVLLFLTYFPKATPSTSHPDKDSGPTFRTALAVVLVCVIHAIITVILSMVFVISLPQHLQAWADFLGILAAVLASIQYFPQIYTTYVLKRVGSLSIPTMCIQTPGRFIWAGSLAARLGPTGWSAWGVYVVTGLLQGTLLVMGSYFELMHKRREEADIKSRLAAAEQHPDASEETPLLRSTSQ